MANKEQGKGKDKDKKKKKKKEVVKQLVPSVILTESTCLHPGAGTFVIYRGFAYADKRA